MKRGSRKSDKGTRRARHDIAPLEASATIATAAYEVQGDAAAALATYRSLLAVKEPSLTQIYNQRLLAYLESGGRDTSFLKDMNKWKSSWEKHAKDDEGLPPRKKKCKELTVVFNDCLLKYVNGRETEASERLLKEIKPMALQRMVLQKELLNVVTRMTFLLLDCMLLISEASHSGLKQMDKEVSGENIMAWLESQEFGDDAQLKFLLSLYKSRLDFAARDDEESRLVDSKVRGVKKELKLAMELFNHKLRTSGDTGSVGGSSDIHSEDGSERSNPVVLSNAHSSPQERLMQAHNQSALSLKAHLEQLKGNTKKSLVLCSEARASLQDPSYDRIDSNNLSIVYATSRKKHLALYTAAKALRAPRGGNFRPDGTACPDSTLAVLHNSAICALQGRNYEASYESFAQCVKNSDVFFNRPRCWLRMAEACLGIHAERKSRSQGAAKQEGVFSVVDVDGAPKGIVIDACPNTTCQASQKLSDSLGTQEDLAQIRTQPLLRAMYCLEVALKQLETDAKPDPDCLQGARCSLAYIKLEVEDYKAALELSRLVLSDLPKEGGGSNLRSLVRNKRLAAARLYGCEASCALGDTESALKFLTGEKQEDSALDRLSVHLAGVSTAMGHGQRPVPEEAKIRLKRAQRIVRTSASVASSKMNKLGTAKQLAMSAISLEDSLPVSDWSSTSSARNALLYCMLCEGNREGTLAVLRSSR